MLAPKDALQNLQDLLPQMPEVKLVIIDPIFKFTRISDSNDYAKVNNALEPVLALARNHELHIVIVHHKKKKQSEDGMDDVLGSTAIAGAVDTVIALDIDRHRDQSQHDNDMELTCPRLC